MTTLTDYTREYALGSQYAQQDRTTSGVCMYCRFWPCVCEAPNNAFRAQLRRLSGLSTMIECALARRKFVR